ncbi:transglutaminaseTgpA domain-containing protein [Nocardiopsis tropica]|uniref:TransglutaminaseTgpA domain-containing protein n=1 Tax=Nocardiopsis tropica TaxID=109330 RepID=A0ABV1ZR19_9ACTN
MPLASLVCLLSALPLLGTVVRGETWWVPAAFVTTAVCGISALYRLSGWNSLPVPFLQLFAVAFLSTPLFAPHEALLGLLPTWDSLEHLAQVFGEGVASIDGNAPPVAASYGVTMIIALVFAVFAMASDFLAVTARCPGMVGGLLLALVAVPLVVDDAGVGAVAAASCALGFLFLLAVDMWVRGREWGTRVPDGRDPSARLLGRVLRVATVSAASAAAVLLALTVPLAVPSLRSDAFYAMADGAYTGGDVLTTTHPLVSLRRELGASSDRTVLTYRTDAEQPDYLRTYVLNEFDGENWTMTPVSASGDTLVSGELPLPAGWDGEPDGGPVTTRISLDSDSPRMDFLPLPYWARAVDAPGEWYADPDSLMVFTTDSPPTGLNFSVETVDRVPTGDELAGSGAPVSLPGDHRNLPSGLDPSVQALTDGLVEGAESPYERALAIQEYFTGGLFTYDLSPPGVPEGADPLSHFLLEDRVGYCEQFAGAMAVMARQADIPARVAVGYTAGERMGDGRWAVTVGDAHAWPELYFEGAGWVRFEPTPAASGGEGQGSATVPDYASGDGGAGERPAEEPGGPDTESSPSTEPSEDAEEPDASPGADEAPEDRETEPASASGGGSDAGPDLSWLPAAGGAIGALLLLALPALARALLRWSRTTSLSGGEPAAAAHTAWRELRDTCLDLGGPWAPTESPRATAERLSRFGAGTDVLRADGVPAPVPAEAVAALWRLALAEESARYAPAPTGAGGLRADLAAACAGLAAAAGRGARVRAALLPRSLAPWHRPRPTRDLAATTP